MLCDCILASEKLVYENADYWIECFNLIRRIIGGVDYKGVREIMKVGCFDYEYVLFIFHLGIICEHPLSLHSGIIYSTICHQRNNNKTRT